MLTLIGEYQDTLRAVGHYLEQVGAGDVTIIEEPHDLGVIWRGPDGRQQARAIAAAELRALRISARLFRGTSTPATPARLAQRLRMLGAVADQLHAAGVVISETSGGFRLAASQHDRRFAIVFSDGQLGTRAIQAQRHRSAGDR